MIIAIANFKLPGFVSLRDATALFHRSAEEYLDMPGLIQKFYLRSEDGLGGGAVYWWKDRSHAEARFTPEWIEEATTKYGAAPTISWFDSPVMVDASQRIVRDTAPSRK